MKVFLIKRLPTQSSGSAEIWCDTFLGKTEKEAITDAVNSVMIDWFNERVEEGEAENTDDVESIFDQYVDFWMEEEEWEVTSYDL